MTLIRRRAFLQGTAASVATLSASSYRAAGQGPNEKTRLAVMGVRGRGRGLMNGFAQFADAEIVAVIDPDENVVPEALRGLAHRQHREPRVEKDLRRASLSSPHWLVWKWI